MIVFGLDPGPVKSAICGWNGELPFLPFYGYNGDICMDLIGLKSNKDKTFLAIEKPVCQKYSGVSVSDTAIHAGVFWGVWGPKHCHLITRSKIRWHIGKVKKTNDSVIRKKLIEMIQPNYNLHNNPGLLVGITGDTWQALAVAVTCYDLIKSGEI